VPTIAGGLDVAPVGLGQTRHDGQADPAAGHTLRGVATPKTLEDVGQLIRGDADAVVLDHDLGYIPGPAHRQADPATGRGKLALLTHPWVPEQTIREHTPPPF
jgi:hypothetical protein